MKRTYLILASISISLLSLGCIDDDTDVLTGDAITGGLVELNSQAISYVVGNDGTYTASGNVYQGNVATRQIEIYKSFTNAETNKSTDEVLFTTLQISDQAIGSDPSFSYSFKYEDLIAGLSLEGNPLPDADSQLNIGDFWTLRFQSTTSRGDVVSNASTVKVAVATRFAGFYKAIDAIYYRIGVVTGTAADWPAQTLIESVDATTYRVVEYMGLFNGNEWYFQIDENDRITYPDKTPSGDDQLGNSQPFITCESAPSEMTNVPCGSDSNYVLRNDETGADILYMSFGYLTGGTPGNAREFYQVMQKIVD